HADPIHKVSIVSRGTALGYTWSMPDMDKHLYSKEQFMDDLAQMLGGRVAERLVFKQITTGASNDLQRVTQMARQMVTKYGMSEKLGPVTFGSENDMVFLGREMHESKNYSDAVAASIDVEVAKLVREAERRAEQVLRKHSKELKAIALDLVKKENLNKEEFERFFSKKKK